jgi:hypothetical protein
MIRSQRGLARCLRTLPGKKILLTNAPAHYSRRVLMHLNLHRQFMQHIPVEEMRVHGKVQPKPSRPFCVNFWQKTACVLRNVFWLKTALIICVPLKRRLADSLGADTFRRSSENYPSSATRCLH